VTIKNATIQTEATKYATEAAKPDVPKSSVADDIRDWIEAHQVNNIHVRRVTGCFVASESILLNGRPVLLSNVVSFLENEDTADLVIMRDALAAHFKGALASLQSQKGSVEPK
jgi:restriction endonuclease